MKKEFITLKLSELVPYENNPRINDDAVSDVMESIRQCEYIDPIEIDENNVILSGHTRLKALTKLKKKTADCIRVTGLTEEQKRKYRLLTNKTGEAALWDFEKLDEELDGLDFNGFDFGFDDRFSMDDIEEVQAYDENNDDREYFSATFVFPNKEKDRIQYYLRRHKKEIIDDIIKKASVMDNGRM